ncbi:pseudoazurin [Thauera linaloolentis]|uniref:Pseudoazurin n=1 Tax=Thauera linaloolentis (strain DSM 12138 / JCM 21573 / CCUG 41526 / CIP 105981 / IAM 15112 / NBRC 102519 / 47Lol) TaxID=1123367 RepID=N6YXP3_THAL4|nr:pseudoazurin [Thauera linaloolentis]ENO84714.1 pseudoazurin [Thauera linaloolentis 47Lol = DSM 12138]MCM8567427.1 pseudoazurin [Thauera linaloolentis]
MFNRPFCILALSALLATPAMAEVHEVRMLNRGAAGAMIYEPDFLRVAPGDTVKFIATHRTHNAASLPGLLPEGAKPFKGKIDEEIEVGFDVPGYYGVQCIPHIGMGMVMLIQVGEPASPLPVLPETLPQRAAERFGEIIARESLAK